MHGVDREPSSWLLLGDGGHAASVVAVIDGAGGRVLAVSAPSAPAARASRERFTDDGRALAWAADRGCDVALGSGSAQVRRRMLDQVLSSGAGARPLVAATATVAADASLGPGSFVAEHAHVGPAAVVGRGAVVNTAAVVEHHARVGEFAHCAPGSRLLGGAELGADGLLGAGATVLPAVRIGERAVVGAGAVVLSAVADDVTVVGVPARPLADPPAGARGSAQQACERTR